MHNQSAGTDRRGQRTNLTAAGDADEHARRLARATTTVARRLSRSRPTTDRSASTSPPFALPTRGRRDDFLEDTGEIQQQAQQLKLAELGRLSASIAHEVRNPLGAISHAAQLLNESDELESADQRLTDIIISHCQRMNGVVENVLEMSRRKPPSRCA